MTDQPSTIQPVTIASPIPQEMLDRERRAFTLHRAQINPPVPRRDSHALVHFETGAIYHHGTYGECLEAFTQEVAADIRLNITTKWRIDYITHGGATQHICLLESLGDSRSQATITGETRSVERSSALGDSRS